MNKTACKRFEPDGLSAKEFSLTIWNKGPLDYFMYFWSHLVCFRFQPCAVVESGTFASTFKIPKKGGNFSLLIKHKHFKCMVKQTATHQVVVTSIRAIQPDSRRSLVLKTRLFQKVPSHSRGAAFRTAASDTRCFYSCLVLTLVCLVTVHPEANLYDQSAVV